MAKNRLSNYSKQQTSSMSPSHTYTVGVGANPFSADDEDLDDICPVCDGECTCANGPKPRPALPSNTSGSAQLATTINNSSRVPGLQSLKIKLTVPPGMLSKARAAQAQANLKKSKNNEETTTGFANDGERSSISPFLAANHQLISQESTSGASGSDLIIPKRRGRPPKGAREHARSSGSEQMLDSVNEANTLPSSSLSQLSRSHKFKNPKPQSKPKRKPQTKSANPKGKGTTVKKRKIDAALTTNKRTVVLSEDEFGSELTELDEQGIEDDYDGHSVQYPTFVSASAMSSSAFSEDSETASSSGFDTDSSMEAEEENYILSEERRHERARVRRELLGEDRHKRKDPQNNWVIRPRKQSVGLSDADMDVDSDATEDDDTEDEAEGEDAGDEDEMDDINPGSIYAGVATGWSDDDEESSFDADLFFANLSDSTADGQSGSGGEEGEESDGSDLDTDMAHHAHHAARLQMDNLPFEVSQGWDGQIVFTTGLGEGQGILDLDFEVSAAQLVEDSASPSQDSDVEMQTSECEDDGEYEEMGEFGEGEESDGGDTTDDDYVDKNGLPTSRMLELFHWPSSLSAIDPMSTVSPTASPGPRSRRRNRRSLGSTSRDSLESPRPADILAGRIFWGDDSDEHGRDDVAEGSVASSSRGPPVMGQFYTGQDHPRRAILTGSNKDAPSPFPRLKHRKTRSLSGSLDQLRGRALTRPSSLSVSTTSSVHSSEEHLSLSEHPPAEAIDLHDVLDVSFLESEPLDPLTLPSTSTSEDEARKHLQIVHRWDHIPMGTFRRTRESGAIISDSGSASWQAETPRVTPADKFVQGNSRMLKSSPFSEITWHGRGSNPPKGTRQRTKANKSIAISPVILPVRDGDRTPTNAPHSPPRDQHDHTQRKTRKELRRESKMKRKSYGPAHHQQHRQHFHHNHHPNLKSRSTSSMQRTNFFNSPTASVPPLNL